MRSQMMNKSETAKSILLGSFLVYAIDSLLDKSQRFNGTTINLKQMLLAKTRKAQHTAYVEMSNKAWYSVVDKYKDENYRIYLFDLVEYLGFEEERIMTEMYGDKFIEYISAFSLKHTFDGTDSNILKESRVVSQALIDATRKVVFDSKGEL